MLLSKKVLQVETKCYYYNLSMWVAQTLILPSSLNKSTPRIYASQTDNMEGICSAYIVVSSIVWFLVEVGSQSSIRAGFGKVTIRLIVCI